MKDKLKCPKCKSDYKKARGDATQHCSNPECILWYHEHTEGIDWAKVWRKIRYPSIRDTYYYFKNLIFMRHDLIRTGLSKSNWCDKDYLMFEGMMGLLVDYIEKECPYEMLLTDYDEITSTDKDIIAFDDSQIKAYQDLLDLYIDYKVTYRKLIKDEETSLDEWSKSSEMCMLDKDDKGRKTIEFNSTEGYTDEERKKLLNDHSECEKKVSEFEQNMLHRLVDMRSILWV